MPEGVANRGTKRLALALLGLAWLAFVFPAFGGKVHFPTDFGYPYFKAPAKVATPSNPADTDSVPRRLPLPRLPEQAAPGRPSSSLGPHTLHRRALRSGHLDGDVLSTELALRCRPRRGGRNVHLGGQPARLPAPRLLVPPGPAPAPPGVGRRRDRVDVQRVHVELVHGRSAAGGRDLAAPRPRRPRGWHSREGLGRAYRWRGSRSASARWRGTPRSPTTSGWQPGLWGAVSVAAAALQARAHRERIRRPGHRPPGPPSPEERSCSPPAWHRCRSWGPSNTRI